MPTSSVRRLQLDMQVLPGVATATEAFNAIRAGAKRLKLFPASSYGPKHLQALRTVLPADAGMLAVGGVAAEHIADWLAAGAAGFGFGSELFRPDYALSEIERRAQLLVQTLREARRAADDKQGYRVSLSPIDIAIIGIYAVSIFILAQWVSRDKGTHQKDAQDYFLASRTLPWWAIGTSLIAANISAEQIIGMSGSGYVIGLGIASYEWMAAHHPDHRRQVFPADLSQERHLHHAGVPGEALQHQRAHGHGDLLARRLHLRESHRHPLVGSHGGAHRRRNECRGRARGPGPVRGRLCAVWRTQGRGADGYRAGLAVGARRSHHHLHRPQ